MGMSTKPMRTSVNNPAKTQPAARIASHPIWYYIACSAWNATFCERSR
jgi:ribonuclease I